MPEAMNSSEIEDVLSSIRRLVAQDLKPADRARLAAVADATQKLVLAPELRVEDQPAKFATVRRPSRRAAFPPVDAVLAGVAAGGDQGQDGGFGDAARGDWSLGEARNLAQPAAPMTDFGTVTAQAIPFGRPPSESFAADLPPAGTTFVTQSSDEAMIALPPHYGLDDAPPLEQDFNIDPNARLMDMAAKNFHGHDFAPEMGEEAGEPAQIEIDAISAVHMDAGPSLHGTIEPDADWADDAERRVIAELAGETVEEAVFAQVNAQMQDGPRFNTKSPSPAPEVLFDEDVLRAMVQAIFREEMAGPMGERITRNIRKLVRAEVGRMLAAHELE